MAKMPSQFSTDDLPKSEFEDIPVGEYLAKAVDSEIKRTKKAEDANDDSKGMQAIIKWRLEGGVYDGRIFWTRMNIVNPNAVAVEIGQREWKNIRDAAGVGLVDDTAKVHGIPVVLKIGMSKETAQYPSQNEIKGYKSADGFVPQAIVKAGAAKPTPAAAKSTPAVSVPSGGVKKSWQKPSDVELASEVEQEDDE